MATLITCFIIFFHSYSLGRILDSIVFLYIPTQFGFIFLRYLCVYVENMSRYRLLVHFVDYVIYCLWMNPIVLVFTPIPCYFRLRLNYFCFKFFFYYFGNFWRIMVRFFFYIMFCENVSRYFLDAGYADAG